MYNSLADPHYFFPDLSLVIDLSSFIAYPSLLIVTLLPTLNLHPKSFLVVVEVILQSLIKFLPPLIPFYLPYVSIPVSIYPSFLPYTANSTSLSHYAVLILHFFLLPHYVCSLQTTSLSRFPAASASSPYTHFVSLILLFSLAYYSCPISFSLSFPN